MDALFSNALWSICYLVVVASLSLYGIHRFVICYLFVRHKNQPIQPLSQFEDFPRVTIQLPIFNEYYVGKRLLTAVSKITYPKEKLQIQVLDDSTDETCLILERESEVLRNEGLDVQYIHRFNRIGFKAGALANGLETAKGEFIFILDADFLPEPNILLKTIHHFTDSNIGMVQMRWGHLNRCYSFLTRMQAMFLDGHLLLEQTARSRSGRFFNFNGTAGIWRKSCIETSGGWQHDTLTEDLDLSYRAQMCGWKFIFLPDVVIPAELPIDINGFKSQQHRWTKGSIQTCKKLLPQLWRSPLPLIIKLEATVHLTSNFAYLLLILLCFLIFPNSFKTTHSIFYFFFLDLPVFVLSFVSVAFFYVVAQRHLNPSKWWADIWLLPMLLALGVGMSVNNARGVLEAVLNHRSEFRRTPKYGISNNPRKSHPISTVRYLPLYSLLPFIEFLFAAYFTFCVCSSILRGHWISVPFLLISLGGFAYVASKSVLFWIQRWWAPLTSPQEEEATA